MVFKKSEKKPRAKEGLFTIIGTTVAVIALGITIWQVSPKSSHHLPGEWTVTSIVQQSDYTPYLGARIKWKMFITEHENEIKGTAEKVVYNDKEIPVAIRTKLEIEGTVENNRFSFHYTENGKKRETSGVMTAEFDDNSFKGNFSQSAANSKGIIIGEK